MEPFKVFYIDNEPELLEIYTALMEEWGIQVFSFTDPHDAISCIKKEASCSDLLLIDCHMLKMNGVKFLSHVLSEKCDGVQRVCLFSSSPELSFYREELKRNFDSKVEIVCIDKLFSCIAPLKKLLGVY